MTDADRVLDQLVVWLYGRKCGVLAHVGNARMRFTYDLGYLDSAGPVALSLSLPVRPDPFEHEQCEPFFGGLLPEQGIRQLIEDHERVSRGNDFALLRAIGGECAGAVELWPTGYSPVDHSDEVHWLDPDELQGVVSGLPRRPLQPLADGRVRLSLAGAQDKLPVVLEGARVGVPLGSTPSTHILKLDSADFPQLIVNEAMCLRLAAACGITAAHAEVRRIGVQLVLMVERYDRVHSAAGSPVTRIHQEDLCQALGISSKTKYQFEGGPSLSQCSALIRRVIRPPAAAVLDFAQRVGFNELIGNADAHGKNFSLLLPAAGSPRLAPAYDLIATEAFPGIDDRVAMYTPGHRRLAQLTAASWDAIAAELQLGPAALHRLLRAQARQAVAAVDAITDEFQAAGFDPAVVNGVRDVVIARAARRTSG